MSFFEATVEDFHYPGLTGNSSILKDVEISLESGKCLAITGPNSVGLTTLCLIAAGLAPGITGGDLTGEVVINGKKIFSGKQTDYSGKIGIVFQDPEAQLFNPTIESEIAWGLENLSLARDEITSRIIWAVEIMGLGHLPLSRDPKSLSGGEKKRLAIASVIAMRPEILVLDQPSGGLTPVGCEELALLLNDLKKELNLTLLLAERDTEFIALLADEVVVLEGGVIRRKDSVSEVFLNWDELPESGVNISASLRFSRCVNEERNVLEAMTFTAVRESVNDDIRKLDSSFEKEFPEKIETSETITCENLQYSYEGSPPLVVDGLNLTIEKGSYSALMGENGAGKTTLLRLLLGLLRPDRGRICIDGKDIAGNTIGQNARNIGMAFQRPEAQIFSSTVREEIAFGPENLGIDTDIDEIMQMFKLSELAGIPPAVLSFSQRRLVAIASIASMRTPIIVLDEPFVGLDSNNRKIILSWLDTRHREGATIIVATHLVDLASNYAGEAILLHDGQIAYHGRFTEMSGIVGEKGLHSMGLVSPFSQRLGFDVLLSPEDTAKYLSRWRRRE